ncbi:hypothetical protein IRJ41_002858 [Triplophysa rosa]|uniref:Uncharacterized protein n=1 Tax=Triplophysa rosa TaxID=992332 RepID=A0A9W7TQP3_TRIRA|nr:hypothetical protein IRJ41_002858 [Triplophysa rosa]
MAPCVFQQVHLADYTAGLSTRRTKICVVERYSGADRPQLDPQLTLCQDGLVLIASGHQRGNAGSASGAWRFGYVRTTFEMADSLTAVHSDSVL